MACAEMHNMSYQSPIPLAERRCEPPAPGLSISLLAINNVEHRHDKPGDEEVILVTHTREKHHTHTHTRNRHAKKKKKKHWKDNVSNAY